MVVAQRWLQLVLAHRFIEQLQLTGLSFRAFTEMALFLQTLVENPESIAVPYLQLYLVAALVNENIQTAIHGFTIQLRGDHC